MTDTCKIFKGGAAVLTSRDFPAGMYSVTLRGPAGELVDRVRCDDYRASREYFRAFSAIARGMA